MKRFLALCLALVLVLGLCACDGGSSESAGNVERDKVTSAVRGRAVAAMLVKYETSGSPTVTMPSVKEVSDNTWEVSGKITVNDKYGDTYSCTYDAEVTYDEEAQSASVVSFDHTTPTKS